MSILFGPVPSRRYGRSLGIDLVPMKTCSLNCIFCQLGSTPEVTLERADYVPLESVKAALVAWQAKGETADILTLCGSGEPTLHRHFGQVIDFIQETFAKPTLIMSNGSLFHLPEVREDAAKANRVKVTLQAGDEAIFQAIARPAKGLTLAQQIAGYVAFRKIFKGLLDVEIFIVPGMNDTPEQLAQMKAILSLIAPDTITVNTAERPPADAIVQACSPESLTAIKAYFSQICDPLSTDRLAVTEVYSEANLLALMRRHPLSVEAFAEHFQVSPSTIRETLLRNQAQEPLVSRVPGL